MHGKYLVIFIYNEEIYKLTEYQKQGIDIDKNSDVIEQIVNLDGTERKVAMTNNIEITDVSVSNIDAGFVNKQYFDFEITKRISKIVVTTAKQTKSYEYDNVEIAKIDIPGKELNGAIINIEYTIKVKNIGDYAGYAKRIMDYLPKNTAFNSTTNITWYLGNDDNLHNVTLESTLINPGEEKEVKLVLAKKMINSDTEIIENNAELIEIGNDKGALVDIDVDKSNNKDIAKVIITVKTGAVYIISTVIIIVVILIIISIVLYYKKKKKLFKGGEV